MDDQPITTPKLLEKLGPGIEVAWFTATPEYDEKFANVWLRDMHSGAIKYLTEGWGFTIYQIDPTNEYGERTVYWRCRHGAEMWTSQDTLDGLTTNMRYQWEVGCKDNPVHELSEVIPAVLHERVRCPDQAVTRPLSENAFVRVEGPCRWSSTLGQMVIHLNDVHKTSREGIADWLESLGIDLTFQPRSTGN